MTRRLAVDRSELPSGIVAIPVRTPIVHPGADLANVVADSVRGIARPGDVLAVSETALAIAQGRIIPAERVRPTSLAYGLSRRAGALATVNQPESLQLVIDEVGPWKVLYASAMHVLGRFVGRRGMFYEVMGDTITAIDGYTGTMPPFERAIVFAPRAPDEFVQTVAAATGIACAVVDVNDLQRAKVLASSTGIDRRTLEHALLDNPHGNGDEQTPIVILKWRGSGGNPLLAA